MGKTTDEAAFAMARAYRVVRKGASGALRGEDQVLWAFLPRRSGLRAAEREAFEAVLVGLASYGLRGEEALHAARGFRSMVHGFPHSR
jgi:hypothetical protein